MLVFMRLFCHIADYYYYYYYYYYYFLPYLLTAIWDTRWRSWLRHCARNEKVAGSIPDGLIENFSLT